MERVYRLDSGKIFKITEDGLFYSLDISGNWVKDYDMEYVYYDASSSYDEIDINTIDIPKVDIESIIWTYENIDGIDVKYNREYRLYYMKDKNNNWLKYFPLEKILIDRDNEDNKIK